LNLDVTNNKGVGLSYSAALSVYKNRNFVKLNYVDRTQISIFCPDAFKEINLLYGKEIPITDWFAVDIFGGVGLLIYEHDKYGGNIACEDQTYYKEKVVGFPFQFNFRYNPFSRFSMGLQLNTNFNKITSIYDAAVFVRIKL
jgi:hypothetical protein